MSSADYPLTDPRGVADVKTELIERARAWVPKWQFDEIPGDFGQALLVIASRMSGRVLDALARTPEKNQRGLLWWLGVAPFPAQAASMPVFFQLTPTATAVTAPQGTRLQASLAQPTIFETLDAVRIVPGTIAALVGAEPSADQYFLPSTGFLTAGQPPASQTQWTTLKTAPFPPTVLQLSSATGLAVGLILLIAGRQFRVTAVQSSVVTLSSPGPADPSAPAAPTNLSAGTLVQRLDEFAPFGPTALGNQEHSLLLGDDALLNIPAATSIDLLIGSGAFPDTVGWSYWGMSGSSVSPGWQPITADATMPGIVTLTKKAGASAPVSLGGISTRWLRASLPSASSGTVELSSLQLRLRSDPATGLKYNALWNNTPLVSKPFLPLGPLPRLFDAFYVGCAEAFGKPLAFVTLDFDVYTPSTNALMVWRAGSMMFGVGKDRRLQRIQVHAASGTARFLKPAQPAESDVPGGTTRSPIALRALRTPPPLIYSSASTASVLISSRHHVWMWTERGPTGFWTALGESKAPIDGLVALRNAPGARVVVLSEGRLRYFDFQPDRPSVSFDWEELPAPFRRDGGGAEPVHLICGVRTGADDLGDALIAVSSSGRLRHYHAGDWDSAGTFDEAIDPDVAPCAATMGRQTAYVAKLRDQEQLVAWRSGSDAPAVRVPGALASGFEALHAADRAAADFTVLMLMRPRGEAPRISWWRPFSGEGAESLYSQRPPAGPQPLAGTPAVLGDLLVTAGADSVLFTSHIQPDAHFSLQARDLFSVALVAAGAAELGVGEVVARMPPDKLRSVSRVAEVRRLADGGALVRFDERVSRPDTLISFRRHGYGASSVAWLETALSVVIEPGGPEIQAGDTLMLGRLVEDRVSDARLYDAGRVEAREDGVHVTLDREVHRDKELRVWLVRAGEAIAATVRPAVPIPELPASVAHPEQVLAQGALYSSDADPMRLEAALYVAADKPFVVLAANWRRAPKLKPRFDALVLRPAATVSPPVDSPVLQWQYWNGTSWLAIPGIGDDTAELTTSGSVTFCVPQDLTATTVAGKKDAWIRACLIAGNYGLESYDVTATVVNPKTTTYTATPDDTQLAPPEVNSLTISYRVCQAQPPAYVLSYDSGSYGDQSNANRAGTNAVVQAFIPLAAALSSSTPSSSAPAASAALFVGFDRPIDPGTISLLWEVSQEDFSAMLPLEVAAVGPSRELIGLTSGDHTRALGETQILTVDLATKLTQVSLFGQSLYWLRLQPARAGSWSPRIDAVYLNGVWAAAQETQKLEILGSSIGAPSARFSLLRTPVLEGSLQLRVGEKLSDADRAALLEGDANRVLTHPGSLTGDWVLWDPVPDTATCAADARVYMLDTDTGVITFGDGVHGLIPPVGSNNVMAFQYQRGGGAAANAFAAWGSLSLVSPVQGVSAVLAPEPAAGGSDPTPVDSLLRIAPAQISQRDRAITARDIEQLAIQSSPAIAQARAWQSGRVLRLVTLVVGARVTPTLAQLRALQGFLRARSTTALAAMLEVVRPRLVSTRITIAGDVASFDAAAQVGADVVSALGGLFDPQTGGVDGTGWPLGRAPVSDDIVAALNSVQNLTAIVSVSLEAVDEVGNGTPMPLSFAPDQFPVWADAGVQFNVLAAAA